MWTSRLELWLTTYPSCSVIYLLGLGFTAWAMWPNKANDVADEDDDDVDSLQSASAPAKANATVQMRSLHTPGFAASDSPFTPRTTAFHTLNRDLPLRQQYA